MSLDEHLEPMTAESFFKNIDRFVDFDVYINLITVKNPKNYDELIDQLSDITGLYENIIKKSLTRLEAAGFIAYENSSQNKLDYLPLLIKIRV